ncbi:MAG: InlB B-repeat-containing protein, partial [Candidatus Micrarchaeia archaeon]
MKQQSALEFILTYSWAIVIISLFVASVFLLSGYKPPSYYLSSSCYIEPLMPCVQSILTYNSVAPLRFAIVFKNALGTAMLIPQNGINVTVTNIGVAGTNSYVGNCYPRFIPTGEEALCVVSIPGSTKPGVGTQVSIPFTLSYNLCNGPSSKTCQSALYKTTGTAMQLVAPSYISIYSLSMNSSTKGAYIMVNGVAYATNSTAFFASNKYTLFAKPPAGYAFSAWSISSISSSLSSSTSQTTTLTLSSNATVVASFVLTTTSTSTSTTTSTTQTTTSTTSTSTSTTFTTTSTT